MLSFNALHLKEDLYRHVKSVRSNRRMQRLLLNLCVDQMTSISLFGGDTFVDSISLFERVINYKDNNWACVGC
jgi:hypothetical protein